MDIKFAFLHRAWGNFDEYTVLTQISVSVKPNNILYPDANLTSIKKDSQMIKLPSLQVMYQDPFKL